MAILASLTSAKLLQSIDLPGKRAYNEFHPISAALRPRSFTFPHRMIKLLFGKAGSGKSYIGKLASNRYGFHFYDADDDLPERFRRAMKDRQRVTDDVREEYIDAVIAATRRLVPANQHLCVCQALFRNKYREKILEAIPSVEYVWVDASDELISSRLENRTGHLASKDYALMVNRIFEVPTVPHVRFENGNDPVQIDVQMKVIFDKRPAA